ncbi:MAG: hypothetical protein A7315_09830 [Candidatus Altiarchaeales archaeon WOR_SM1_79]|nr:MAG: hypothetical protein A7315_09830 [Candidatus Altiarchaeales archaeon WOR_SM1_79]
MKIALIQTDIKTKKEENVGNILNHIKNFDADIYCLPEVFSTGFNYKDLAENAEQINGQTIQKLRETGKTISGTFVEKEGGRIYNTAFFISEGELIGTYRKIHRFNLEKDVFSQGDKAEVIQTKSGKIGFLTCYDIRFPEHARKLALEGAEILFVPANFPNPRMRHWRLLLQARALENLCYIIAVNRVGRDENNSYFGHSMIVSPLGEIMCEAGNCEEIITHDIDVFEVNEAREKLPYLSDIAEL